MYHCTALRSFQGLQMLFLGSENYIQVGIYVLYTDMGATLQH